MDDMARFLEQCFERDLAGFPPVDFEAIRSGRLPPRPPESAADHPDSDHPDTDRPAAATAPVRSSPGARNGIGPSAVFTVRLARDDLALLERRARLAGLSPSALARNLINVGLRDDGRAAELAEAVRKVQDAAAQLRAALP